MRKEPPDGRLAHLAHPAPEPGVVKDALEPVEQGRAPLPARGDAPIDAGIGRQVRIGDGEEVKVEVGPVDAEAALTVEVVCRAAELVRVREEVAQLALPLARAAAGGQAEPVGEEDGLEGALEGPSRVAERGEVAVVYALVALPFLVIVAEPARAFLEIEIPVRHRDEAVCRVGASIPGVEAGVEATEVVRVVKVRLGLAEFDRDVVCPAAEGDGS